MSARTAIVIGGGINGLTAAAYLARGGVRVTVLEGRAILGGLYATGEFHPGFRASRSSGAGLLLGDLWSELDLGGHGVSVIPSPVHATAVAASSPPISIFADAARTSAGLEARHGADAHALATLVAELGPAVDVVREAMRLAPPSLPNPGAREVARWVRVALGLRRRGVRATIDTLRAAVLSIGQLLDERLASDSLKGLLALDGVRGLLLGPRGGGTAFQFLYRRLGALGSPVTVRGGSGAVASALASVIRARGGEVRTGAAVARIRVHEGRAVGVTLAPGDDLDATVVLSSLDPRRTFFDLVGAPLLEPRFVREVRAIRFRAASARISLALSRLPAVAGMAPDDERMGGSLVVCPSVDYLERAYDAAKHGDLPPLPALELTIPSVVDPDLAPRGHHVMTIEFFYAPYRLARGTWDDRRNELFERAMAVLRPLAPELEASILASRIETPVDVEREVGATCGDVHHGQMALDQLFFLRPVPGFARYATPIAGLYLCGAGTHPGGGMTGAPGRNAAIQASATSRSSLA